MKKKVLITIAGTQQFAEGYDDKQEFFTLGTFDVQEGIFYISYQESEITGMEGVTTTLRIEPNYVILNRIGTVEVKQEFRPGILYRSTYITPFGDLLLSILSDEVESDLTAQGGRISLKYNLFVDDKFVSHNTLVITVKEESL
ncbi:MAG: YwiB family protein [Desulfitobacteriaceae bacterium]